jgi:hypothetical protein
MAAQFYVSVADCSESKLFLAFAEFAGHSKAAAELCGGLLGAVRLRRSGRGRMRQLREICGICGFCWKIRILRAIHLMEVRFPANYHTLPDPGL